MKVDLGCGRAKAPGFAGMDRVALPGVDVVHDLEDVPWPFPDASVEALRASHVLEHVRDLIPVIEEAHRVLVPGGSFEIIVPHWDTDGAHQDPTHLRFFAPGSFDYFRPDHPMNYISRARFVIVSKNANRLPFPLLWRKGELHFLLRKA